MRQLLALFIVAFSLVLGTGCSRETAPKVDPNFKPTTNPSDVNMDQMRKMAPGGGKAVPAPAAAPAATK